MELVEHKSLREFMCEAKKIGAHYQRIDGVLCFIAKGHIHVVECKVARR